MKKENHVSMALPQQMMLVQCTAGYIYWRLGGSIVSKSWVLGRLYIVI